MPFFNIGDKVYKKENPNKIYTVEKRTNTTHCISNYILIEYCEDLLCSLTSASPNH